MLNVRCSKSLPVVAEHSCTHRPHAVANVRAGSFAWQSGSIKHLSRRFSTTSQRHSSKATVCSAAERPSLQLATAKLPGSVDSDAFIGSLYTWASTLTSSGRNLPFALPLKVLKQQTGFEISLLTIVNGEPVPVGSLEASVEEEPNVGQVLFVRFYEGDGAQADRNTPLPSDQPRRLKTVLDGLVDVPLIMGSMKNAIKQAVVSST